MQEFNNADFRVQHFRSATDAEIAAVSQWQSFWEKNPTVLCCCFLQTLLSLFYLGDIHRLNACISCLTKNYLTVVYSV